jgi:sulfite reductase (NADPH) hemoprotein beta-component
VVGPSFAATEITEAIEAVIDVYRALRHEQERFIDTLKRVGHPPFKDAANAVRVSTARAAASTATEAA